MYFYDKYQLAHWQYYATYSLIYFSGRDIVNKIGSLLTYFIMLSEAYLYRNFYQNNSRW